MKVTVELLARLLELERRLQTCVRQQALTAAEVDLAKENIALVREVIPECVLTSYERMKITEVELLDCPHAFAVAVLLSSYREVSREGRNGERGLLTRASSPLQVRRKPASWPMRNSRTKRR
jgi:hypothetical protein